jgi:hypothetical protein
MIIVGGKHQVVIGRALYHGSFVCKREFCTPFWRDLEVCSAKLFAA